MRLAPTLSLLLLASGAAQAQTLTEWVQTNPTNRNDQIALGYPPPIPVDTPMPFDGFRTYAGLHMRHEDLANTTPWVHQHQVGTTRNGRPIWAYRLGDEDKLTRWGLPEPATLANGGIHAREWQTPETVTGIMELIATHESDNHYYDYLRDNINMVVIPVLNVDGFQQTQRFPTTNWVGADPDNPGTWPRDGRMRRKNMLGVDEVLSTTGDHLGGVDLNRNNAPFHATSNRSSSDARSLVYHGAGPQSEPETQALDAAAALGPADMLRVYTDVHSFSQVHFWSRSSNDRLTRITEQVLSAFSQHHIAFPAGKNYVFGLGAQMTPDVGIGSTDEYFTQIYQVPAWTLEVEPSNGQSFFPNLPGGGADYGGAGVNGHDGFILPESQIKRVREQLAETFSAVYYRQAGSPNVQQLNIIDPDTGAVVYKTAWDLSDALNRDLFRQQVQDLEPGKEYQIWIGFDRPMRWLVDDAVTVFPGKSSGFHSVLLSLLVGDNPLSITTSNGTWAIEPGGVPMGYVDYKTDAWHGRFVIDDVQANRDLLGATAAVEIQVQAFDIIGQLVDGQPATIPYWDNGHWHQLESNTGVENDFGGLDKSYSVDVSVTAQDAPFVTERGLASVWFDVSHNGEGFVLEMTADGRAVMYWFTYDDVGNQAWYLGIGQLTGNRIVFPELLRSTGGNFGPNYDPATVSVETVGSAEFLWSGCGDGTMDWRIGPRVGRQTLTRLTDIVGMDCGIPTAGPLPETALLSGTWFDPAHNGEGFVFEVLAGGQALVYWFSYDPDGNQRWFFGLGEEDNGKFVFNDLLTPQGGIFGNDFDPSTVSYPSWGSLELEMDCNGGTATYTSTEAGFGSGTQDIIQLSQMDGLVCPD